MDLSPQDKKEMFGIVSEAIEHVMIPAMENMLSDYPTYTQMKEILSDYPTYTQMKEILSEHPTRREMEDIMDKKLDKKDFYDFLEPVVADIAAIREEKIAGDYLFKTHGRSLQEQKKDIMNLTSRVEVLERA